MAPLSFRPIAESVWSPSAVCWGERRVAVFARGANGELVVLERDGAAWTGPRSLGAPIARIGERTMPADWPIAACVTNPAEVQLVARGPEGDLLHGTYRRGEWGGFECIGSPAAQFGELGVPMALSSAPVACSRAPGKMDVFAVGSAGLLLHSEWDGEQFGEFETIGGIPSPVGAAQMPVPPPIAACNCGPRAMVVAARGATGDLVLKWWNAGAWAPFASLGMPSEPDPIYPAVPIGVPLASAPVVCGGGSARLDVFARGARGDLLHRWWDGKTWKEFESVGFVRPAPDAEPVPLSGVSLACVWGRFELDVLVRGSDGKLYGATWSGSGGIATPRT